jgi:hypothetical protein
MVAVDVESFQPAFLDKADQVFVRPSPLYSWNDIVSGAAVRSQASGTRRMFAVGQNTFRGFYRINKACPGAKQAFINYFRDEREALIADLTAVRDIVNDENLDGSVGCQGNVHRRVRWELPIGRGFRPGRWTEQFTSR